jgi:choline dehydrogenase-like flavoprotein
MKRKHVIIGGGTSGLALSRRLLETDDVILIDRGVIDQHESGCSEPRFLQKCLNLTPEMSQWPLRAFSGTISSNPDTAPQRSLCARSVPYAQGLGNGGCGGINAMIFTLGNDLVYSKLWPDGWNARAIQQDLQSVLEYYRPAVVKTSGNMEVLMSYKSTPQHHTSPNSVMDKAGVSLSYFASIDPTFTKRVNQAHFCLKDTISAKGTLTIVQCRDVRKILFDGTRARSVVLSSSWCNKNPSLRSNTREITTGEVEEEIMPRNGGEIILCAGVLETPRILLASGLRRHHPLQTPASQENTKIPLESAAFAQSSFLSDNKKAEKPSNESAAPGLQQDSHQDLLPDLEHIGEHLQDHLVLPYMLLGNWASGWQNMHPKTTPAYAGKPQFPLNGVHGWINLCADGEVWSDSCSDPPRY